MTDSEVVSNYKAARTHKPLLCEKSAHARWKLALKEAMERRGLELPADASGKVAGCKPSGEERHSLLVRCNGQEFAPYRGPKGHAASQPMAEQIDETVLVQDESPAVTAEVVELARPKLAPVERCGEFDEPQQMAAAIS